MKKYIAIILALVFTLSLASCGAKPNDENLAEEAKPNKWGVTLTAENVTSKGLTLVCKQSGGEDVAELTTGSPYVIEKLDGEDWVEVPYAPQEYDVVWDMMAYLIRAENTTTWDVNFEWLYGELPAGEYRIGKEISNFRGPGENEKETLYARFTVK